MSCIKPLASAGFVVLLCACGGGDDIATKTVTGSNAITVSAPAFVGTVHAGAPVTFTGGACGGGNGEFTAT